MPSDPIRKTDILLKKNVSEMARCKAWNDMMGSGEDITLFAYTALQVEARKPGTIPAEVIKALGKRLDGSRLCTSFIDKVRGESPSRQFGSLIADQTGTAMAYALVNLQARGTFFISPQTEIYAGQIVGEHIRPDDLSVNVAKAKHLTNFRAKPSEVVASLNPPRNMSLDDCIEFLAEDELLLGFDERAGALGDSDADGYLMVRAVATDRIQAHLPPAAFGELLGPSGVRIGQGGQDPIRLVPGHEVPGAAYAVHDTGKPP